TSGSYLLQYLGDIGLPIFRQPPQLLDSIFQDLGHGHFCTRARGKMRVPPTSAASVLINLCSVPLTGIGPPSPRSHASDLSRMSPGVGRTCGGTPAPRATPARAWCGINGEVLQRPEDQQTKTPAVAKNPGVAGASSIYGPPVPSPAMRQC